MATGLLGLGGNSKVGPTNKAATPKPQYTTAANGAISGGWKGDGKGGYTNIHTGQSASNYRDPSTYTGGTATTPATGGAGSTAVNTPMGAVTPNPQQSTAWQDTGLQLEANKPYLDMMGNANRPNESNMYGGRQYGTDAQGRTTITDTMNPWEQTKYSQESWLGMQQNTAAGNSLNNLAQTAATPFNYNSAPKLPGLEDFGAERQRVEDSVYGSQSKRLDQQYGKDEENMRQRLAEQGLTPGSEGYNREMQTFQNSKQDAYQGARDSAIQQGGAEQQRLYNQALSGRQQSVGEQNTVRNQPFSEYSALRGQYGSGVNQPQYTGMMQLGANAPDTQTSASNYANMDAQKWIAQLDADTKKELAKKLSGGGGGGGGSSSSGAGLSLSNSF